MPCRRAGPLLGRALSRVALSLLALCGGVAVWLPSPAAALSGGPSVSAAPSVGAEACSSPGWLCFDELVSGSDVAAADLTGARAGPALVLSEPDAALLTGFDTAAWATSGDRGLLNTLAPSIEVAFDTPVVSVLADVLSLPGPTGAPLAVVLQAWSGDTLVGLDISNLALLGESGRPEDTLGVAEDAGITRISLFAGIPCEGMLCFEKGPTSSFWVDTVRFRSVPEPATILLLTVGFAGLGRGRPRRGRQR